MAKLINTILLGCVAIGYVAAYSGFDLPPGPYCGSNNECCRDRRDQCAHRILDTLCYCDEFCNRNGSNLASNPNDDDCCPDYPEVCLGIRPTSPPEPLIQPCKMKGKLYLPGQKAEKDCNVCECVADAETKLAEWKCEEDPCIISDEVVSAVNNARRSWRAYNYTEFQGKKLKDGLTYKLGTLPLSPDTLHMRPISLEKEVEFPQNFDARSKWPNYISPVVDQGWCGSDWAVSLATIASDRFAIQSNGAENVILSPQMLLSCNRRQQRGCDGGHIDVAWNFARTSGLVDETCFPYKAKVASCPYKPKGSLLNDGCRPSSPRRTDRYKVGPPVRLQKEDAIMNDIKESGPVMAIMTVYQDFFHYRDGVYRHTPYGDNRLKGLHSVRIVGWGEDGYDKYWIVANSWGPQWGENGYFRIARGENESGIEWFVVTALAQVDQAFHRK